ncbi:hypothetical protein FRB99_007592 [Tulasnella sp. 403]|nr:hypothetical protein FRB99_007592 [Tulasnella sp. 403]
MALSSTTQPTSDATFRINDLPNELLVHAFVLGAIPPTDTPTEEERDADEEDEISEPRRYKYDHDPWLHKLIFPVVISHVSSRWRSIALSTPALWSPLMILDAQIPLKWAKTRLLRSGNVPLDIVMGLSVRSTDYIDEIFNLVAPNITRWRRFNANIVSLRMTKGLAEYFQPKEAPLLEKLVIVSGNPHVTLNNTGYVITPYFQHVKHFPRLEHLEMHATPMSLPISCPKLKVLSLGKFLPSMILPLVDFIAFLRELLLLETLELYGPDLVFNEELVQAIENDPLGHSITFPNLKTLKIGWFLRIRIFVYTMSLVHAPVLEDLALNRCSEEVESELEDEGFDDALSHLWAKLSYPHLKSLKLDHMNFMSADLAEQLLSNLPDLRKLWIVHDNKWEDMSEMGTYPLYFQAFTPLEEREDNSLQPRTEKICPRLEELKTAGVDDETLRHVIWTLRGDNYPLKKVVVDYRTGMSQEELKKSDIVFDRYEEAPSDSGMDTWFSEEEDEEEDEEGEGEGEWDDVDEW